MTRRRHAVVLGVSSPLHAAGSGDHDHEPVYVRSFSPPSSHASIPPLPLITSGTASANDAPSLGSYTIATTGFSSMKIPGATGTTCVADILDFLSPRDAYRPHPEKRKSAA